MTLALSGKTELVDELIRVLRQYRRAARNRQQIDFFNAKAFRPRFFAWDGIHRKTKRHGIERLECLVVGLQRLHLPGADFRPGQRMKRQQQFLARKRRRIN